MAATTWTASGTIEVLGNSVFQKDGILYSGARVRQTDGKSRILRDLLVARDCHLLVNVGAQVAMVGVILEKKHLLVALRTEGETVDDVDAVLRTKRTLTTMGIGYGAVALLLCWTIVMPLALAFPVIRVPRNAASLPTVGEMEAMVAALDQG